MAKKKDIDISESIELQRKVYCNRTLNLRSIKAIGYDMDYTLIHYHVEEWEDRAYRYLKQEFLDRNWPVEKLEFQPDMVCRGLVIDTENGNLLKANRFGFVKKAMHGTKLLDFEIQRSLYSQTIIDLAESRWVFLNTLFSLSEGCMYAQLVDLLDQRKIPEVLGYKDLYNRVRFFLEAAHLEGRLKSEIMADPKRFVILDPEATLTLLDQKNSGKKIILITNSEWSYTSFMMSYSFDRYMPPKTTWRDIFDLVIVSAKKPLFFTEQYPLFEVVTNNGLLRSQTGKLRKGAIYLGGSAQQIEKHFGYSGDEILYVGDHMFGDVHVTKNVLRWRTALILRELEEEILFSKRFYNKEMEITKWMLRKEELEAHLFKTRLELQRKRCSYGPECEFTEEELEKSTLQLKEKIEKLDFALGPLVRAGMELSNQNWGLLLRAGNDKSYFAYQLERYADIYTSRVSNLLAATPFSYLRSSRGYLPHDLAIRLTSSAKYDS